MSKKHGIYAGMPFSFNHNGENIVGKVTKVKETASGLEFDVEPFEKFDVAAEKFKATVKIRPSEIYDAISKKAKPDDSLMAKIFGAQSFIGDYPHPDSKDARVAIKESLNSASDFMIRGESLELRCEVCNKYFKPTKDLHYVAKTHTMMFMAPDVETFHDAYDCPRCGSQIIAKERASAAK